jgi:hypothetical protein
VLEEAVEKGFAAEREGALKGGLRLAVTEGDSLVGLVK